jgi:His Kinase A (phospho-acceptor) domain
MPATWDFRERIAALVDSERQFATNASHQLRSALTGLTLRLEELAGSPVAETRAEAEEALAQVARLDATIDELLRLTRTGRAGERRTFDLAALVREHVRDWQPRFRQAQRSIEVRSEGTVSVHATPGAVGQIVDVLLANALHHGGGRVAFHIRTEPSAASCRCPTRVRASTPMPHQGCSHVRTARTDMASGCRWPGSWRRRTGDRSTWSSPAHRSSASGCRYPRRRRRTLAPASCNDAALGVTTPGCERGALRPWRDCRKRPCRTSGGARSC